MEPVNTIMTGMQEHFQIYKKGVGIDDNYFNIPEDHSSDRAFAVLHPAVKRSFKEIVNSSALYSRMKSTNMIYILINRGLAWNTASQSGFYIWSEQDVRLVLL